MSSIDYVIIVLYLAGMILLGVVSNKKQEDAEDYFIAGRKLGTGSMTALWFSSWVGGGAVIGAAGSSYDMGITGIWYVTAIGVGLILFALIFTKIINRLGSKLNQITLPDFIEDRYGVESRVIATITTVVAFIALTAGQFSAAASVLHVIAGWDLKVSLVIAAVVVVCYTVIGGFLAITYTDWAQGLILFFGIVVLGVPFAWKAVGGFEGLHNTLPAGHFELGAWGTGTIIGLMVSITLSYFTSMDSYTRCFAAKSEKAARNGSLLAALTIGTIAFSATFLGMAAKSLYPELAGGGSVALATLIQNLFPAGIRGFVLVGVLAAVMSTADVNLLTASANITRDIYQRFINPKISEKALLKMGMVSSLVIGVAALIMSWLLMDVIKILYIAFTINSAGLFLPCVIGMFWKKANGKAAFWSMTLTLTLVIGWYLGGTFNWGSIFQVDPLWPGLLLSAILFFTIPYIFPSSKEELQKIDEFMVNVQPEDTDKCGIDSKNPKTI